MKTTEDIEARIRELLIMQQNGLCDERIYYELGAQVSELRWVLGEMEPSVAGTLIENVSNQREIPIARKYSNPRTIMKSLDEIDKLIAESEKED